MIWVGRRQIACKLVTINIGRKCITRCDLLDWKIHMKRVYLTYDNLAKQDGAGAQLQRIFGVYSISMKLRIPYFHSKILETIEERAHNAESADDLMEFLDQVNRNFELPSVVLPSLTEVSVLAM